MYIFILGTYHFICRLESKILACSTWPVEVIRLNMPTSGKGGKSTKVCFGGIYTSFSNIMFTIIGRGHTAFIPWCCIC